MKDREVSLLASAELQRVLSVFSDSMGRSEQESFCKNLLRKATGWADNFATDVLVPVDPRSEEALRATIIERRIIGSFWYAVLRRMSLRALSLHAAEVLRQRAEFAHWIMKASREELDLWVHALGEEQLAA